MWFSSKLFSRNRGSSNSPRPRPIRRQLQICAPSIELLENRVVPALLTPPQVTTAYGINLINFGTTTNPIVGKGAGQTIAIIDPGDDAALVNTGAPNFNTSDLYNFDPDLSLPPLPDPPSFSASEFV
jgi:subtilase family serine protease